MALLYEISPYGRNDIIAKLEACLVKYVMNEGCKRGIYIVGNIIYFILMVFLLLLMFELLKNLS